jgi:hypothetical protein
MPQLHCSVDEATASSLAEEAARKGMSLSSYLAEILRAHTAHWPDGYLSRVVGACAESPLEEATDLPTDDVEL